MSTIVLMRKLLRTKGVIYRRDIYETLVVYIVGVAYFSWLWD